ncbi:CCA tRNA nucleotidyltransferase [bacterium]|nr:CCA tRNA nucleotidyltransferase [bacterium]MBQ9149799.1 CCA tRNA nucleotidyltransferase [bacterium]
MYFEFSENVNDFLKIILKNAQMQDKRVFFVGGIVRDNILNNPILDIDLLLLGNAIEFVASLPESITVKSIHEDFCTAKLSYNGLEIDIASSRKECYPNSGCLPVVSKIGVSLEEDVLRRDFTVNSIYCELTLIENEICYQLIDLVGGVDDIKAKTLRALHSNSYIDDPTRIIRGVGFKYRFGFDFSGLDKNLIESYLENIDYSYMSYDRNCKVIAKTLDSSYRDEIFKEIIFSEYYKIINSRKLDVDFEYLQKIIADFKMNHGEICELYLKVLINRHIDDFVLCEKTKCLDMFLKMKKVDLAYYFYKTKDIRLDWYLSKKDISLNISGYDLIDLGYQQGQIVGKILNELKAKKLDEPEKYPDKDAEINWVLKEFPNK